MYPIIYIYILCIVHNTLKGFDKGVDFQVIIFKVNELSRFLVLKSSEVELTLLANSFLSLHLGSKAGTCGLVGAIL